MIMINSRKDYKEVLKHRLDMLCCQHNAASKKDREYARGMVQGMILALEALAEWEQQQPDANPEYGFTNIFGLRLESGKLVDRAGNTLDYSKPMAETHPCEGSQGDVDQDGNPLDYCNP